MRLNQFIGGRWGLVLHKVDPEGRTEIGRDPDLTIVGAKRVARIPYPELGQGGQVPLLARLLGNGRNNLAIRVERECYYNEKMGDRLRPETQAESREPGGSARCHDLMVFEVPRLDETIEVGALYSIGGLFLDLSGRTREKAGNRWGLVVYADFEGNPKPNRSAPVRGAAPDDL